MDEQTHERVRELIAAIPEGRVATYGDIANAAGLSTPRIVGRILREDGSDLPWHRVLGAQGKPSPELSSTQLALLRAEGVETGEGWVDIERYRWQP
ncbi:MGMT family protein [Bogoriella caseilytica]|uniref:O(6)-alkylguanine repair protein YbaZ n=1 Tax=Bogoriella caseilytica TaxID=56055 RepID=A0A3N2BF17_9MICO|nr:MGMT family protein [Bogoriella caseilytica]ROR73825.1 O(6)-alkylguanine repair protein YbaZ [Bogoriella caseilytica]